MRRRLSFSARITSISTLMSACALRLGMSTYANKQDYHNQNEETRANTLRARSALKLLRRMGLLTPPRCGSLSPLETIAFPLHSAKFIY